MPIAGQSPREVIHTELHKFKHGALHSGSKHGPIVKNRKQAIAIALSESRKARRAGGGAVDPQQFVQALQKTGLGFGALPYLMMMGVAQQAQGGNLAPGWGSLLSGLGFSGQNASPTLASSGLGFSGQNASPTLALSGMSDASGPSTQPATASQPPVVSSTPAATPPVQSMNGQPPGSWTPPTFGTGNWSSSPGRQFGGGMTRAPNPNWMVRNEARSMLHSGPISSIVPGRTDRHNVHVGSGAYVMPADAVSHLGQNNTKAGQAILSRMFGGQGPYGAGKDMAIRHGPGAPKPPRMQTTAAAHIPKFQSSGGGKRDRTGEPVPVVVAGGEFTIPPEAVAAVGGGDIKRGHKILDQWVLAIRKKHIATLKGLPPPAKS